MTSTYLKKVDCLQAEGMLTRLKFAHLCFRFARHPDKADHMTKLFFTHIIKTSVTRGQNSLSCDRIFKTTSYQNYYLKDFISIQENNTSLPFQELLQYPC